MSNKLSKILAVVFLTFLIWWWAYTSQEQRRTLTGTLEKSPTADVSLMVTFQKRGSSVPMRIAVLEALNFKGAPSKINELSRRFRLPQNDPEKERLDFFYMPQEAGTYTIDVKEYLQQSSKMQDLALTLESVEPKQIVANVEKLVEKRLSVQVVDENSFAQKGAVVEPAWVNVYVRPSYSGPATLTLSDQQIQTARDSAVTAKPFVDMGVAGIIREAEEPVKVTIQSGQLLESRPFQPQTIGLIISPELVGKYQVQLLNEADLKSKVQIRASEAAFAEYQKRPFHLLIEIKPGDERLPEIPPQPVIYNFPRDYVRKGEIELVESSPAKTAMFKLVPLNAVPTP